MRLTNERLFLATREVGDKVPCVLQEHSCAAYTGTKGYKEMELQESTLQASHSYIGHLSNSYGNVACGVDTVAMKEFWMLHCYVGFVIGSFWVCGDMGCLQMLKINCSQIWTLLAW